MGEVTGNQRKVDIPIETDQLLPCDKKLPHHQLRMVFQRIRQMYGKGFITAIIKAFTH
jgi:hypothetical protein